MFLRSIFLLRRRWPILLFLPIVGLLMGVVASPRGPSTLTPTYTASALVAVDSSVNPVEIQQSIVDAEQGNVAKTIAKKLGSGFSVDDVSGQLSGSFDDNSFVLRLKAVTSSSQDAVKLVTVAATELVNAANGGPRKAYEEALAVGQARIDKARLELTAFLQENSVAMANDPPPQIQQTANELRSAVEAADSEVQSLRANQPNTETYQIVSISGASPTVAEGLAVPASPTVRAFIGIILGLIAAGALILMVEKLNPRIDDPSAASELIGAPVLAMVPVMGRRKGRNRMVERADPAVFKGPFAESFRSARSHLDFRAAADSWPLPPRILITSATPGEGKSTTAAFLALAYAEAERRPLVVGADVRRPTLHRLFDIPRSPGLSSRAVAGGQAVALAEIVVNDPVSGVSVVPPGPSVDQVTPLVGDLTAITSVAQDSHRQVIIDTAPVMVANDATDFLVATDWVVVIVRVGKSTARSVRQMMHSLSLTGTEIVGVIMVGSLESSDAKRYYYQYYDSEDISDERVHRLVSNKNQDEKPTVVGSMDD